MRSASKKVAMDLKKTSRSRGLKYPLQVRVRAVGKPFWSVSVDLRK